MNKDRFDDMNNKPNDDDDGLDEPDNDHWLHKDIYDDAD